MTAPHIGTLREGALHKGIKDWLARPGDRFEQPVDGYVIDMVRGDLLIEVQTGACTPLRDKLTDLLERHRVRLVLPLARTRTIERVDEDGAPLSRRRAPWEGRIEDVFERLVSIPALLAHRRFELEIRVTAERELRARVAGRGRGRLSARARARSGPHGGCQPPRARRAELSSPAPASSARAHPRSRARPRGRTRSP